MFACLFCIFIFSIVLTISSISLPSEIILDAFINKSPAPILPVLESITLISFSSLSAKYKSLASTALLYVPDNLAPKVITITFSSP